MLETQHDNHRCQTLGLEKSRPNLRPLQTPTSVPRFDFHKTDKPGEPDPKLFTSQAQSR